MLSLQTIITLLLTDIATSRLVFYHCSSYLTVVARYTIIAGYPIIVAG